MNRILVTSILLALLSATAACQRTSKPTRPDRNAGFKIPDTSKREYYKGSPQMQAALQTQIEALQGAELKDQVVAMNRILSHGEPAAFMLEKSLKHASPEVRAMSAYGLGLRRDPRALNALATVVDDPSDKVRFEAATAMVRLGDRRGAPTLVSGLSNPDPLVRNRSIRILESVTGETFGYAADDEPGERNAAIARWRAWIDASNARARAPKP